MRNRLAGLVLISCLSLAATPRGLQQPTPPAPAVSELSPDLLAKLPADWRDVATAHVKPTGADQVRFRGMTDIALRQAIARLLARVPEADAFLKSQVTADAAPAVRTTLLQVMAADARWSKMTDTPGLIESVVRSDPDPGVSIAALETLRRWRMRDLNTLLNERIATGKSRGEAGQAADRLVNEQERWTVLERATMMPAFLRTPPPPFSVKAADARVRVLAFGDFGNGSTEQAATARAMKAYHDREKFDLAITLGDNFYSVGMLSPDDPRWQTQFEQVYGPIGIPFYAALGNHDWGHPDSPAAEVLYSAKSPMWRMPAAYYTFTAGPVQFFALDTQVVATAEKQRQWLDRELAQSRARWKVVYGHHPIYSGGNYEDRPDLIERLLPILRNRADVYLCGHDHNLQALVPEDGVHFYVAGGGGAGLYDLRPYERSKFASRSNGFAVIEGDDTQLVIKLVDATGTVLFTDVVRKSGTGSHPAR